MNCVLCGRALMTSARSIETKDGALHFGPACARKVFVVPPKTPKPVKQSAPMEEADARQLDLLELAE